MDMSPPVLKLRRALRLSGHETVSVVGAGGKTTALFQLARELAPALVTTTTHLGAWQLPLADRHIPWAAGEPLPAAETLLGAGVTLVTAPPESHQERVGGLTPTQLESLHILAREHSRPLLIEADGARQRPLKAPAAHEPVIPPFTDVVVVVAGLSALGKALDGADVHRPEQFAALAGLGVGDRLTPEALMRVLRHPSGGLKGIPPLARRVALLNQAATPGLQSAASQVAAGLLPAYRAVVIAELLPAARLFAVKESVAAVILAAGEASRFGQPKQLLDWQGEPFVRRVARRALDAGLSPVSVVLGAYAEPVRAAVSGLDVRIVTNPRWAEGQSTSLQAGLGTLPADAGAALFLLADQPQVSAPLLRTLVDTHARTLAPIVAPLVEGRRANPVLFDRETFADLLTLRGDVGGRALFSRYPLEYVPWLDAGLLLDVDTQEDYRRLLAAGDGP